MLFMPDRAVRVSEPGLVLPFLLSVLRRHALRGGPFPQLGSASSAVKDKHPGGISNPRRRMRGDVAAHGVADRRKHQEELARQYCLLKRRT